jgi:hypothetical protein
MKDPPKSIVGETLVVARSAGPRTGSVNEALKEYIQRRKQLKILDLFGQIDYDPDHDYKEQRRRE